MSQLISVEKVDLVPQSDAGSTHTRKGSYDDLINHKWLCISEIELKECGQKLVRYAEDQGEFVFSKHVSFEALFFSIFLHERYRGAIEIYRAFTEIKSFLPSRLQIFWKTPTKILLIAQNDQGDQKYLEVKRGNFEAAKIADVKEYFSIPLNGRNYFASRCLYPLPASEWQNRIREVAINPSKMYSPLTVVIETARGCNYGCEFCYASELMTNEFIDPTALLQLVEELKQHGTKVLRFVGFGEQTLHPFFRETLLLAKAYGLGTYVITNGSQLSRSPKFFGEMLDFIRVSFNAGTQETYALVNRVHAGSFNNVLNGIRRVLESRSEDANTPVIGVTSVLMDSNKHEIISFVHLAKQIGANFAFVKFPDIETLSNAESLKLQKDLDQASELYSSPDFHVIDTIFSYERAEKVIYNSHKSIGCVMHQLRCIVKANGDVLSNEQLGGKHYATWGNILESSFGEILFGAARAASQDRRRKTPRVCRPCIFKDLHRFARDMLETA